MVHALLGSLCLVAFFILYKLCNFAKNISLAQRTGLPFVISPLHELEGWAYYTTSWIRRWYHENLLNGEGWPPSLQFMVKDWMYEDKYRAHAKYGDVFLVVSPGGLVCYTADPTMIADICSRRRDFVKPGHKMKIIEPYGPNIVSSEGDLWRRHVRVVAPPLSDAINPPVWIESRRQTDLLLKRWTTRGSSALKSDIYQVALNVMCYAGFGKHYEQQTTNGHKMTLIESITGVTRFLPHLLLYPRWLLPYIGARVGYEAYHEFQRYTADFIKDEKDRQSNEIKQSSSMKGKETLLGALVRTNDVDTTVDPVSPLRKDQFPLTQEDLTGNMFILTRAGYDTTANTMIYTSINLVLYPDIQQRATEEVDRIYAEAAAEGRADLSYEHDFSKFRYLLALMFETLRVFPIVVPIARMTLQEQSVSTSASQHGAHNTKPTSRVVLPAKCGVITNNPGVHNNPSVWPNPHIFAPERWLVQEPNTYDPLDPRSKEQPQVTNTPTTASAMKGTFMTWGEGARACLGRRFAQSEYVSFFSHVLRHYKLELDSEQNRAFVERSVRCRTAGSIVTLVAPDDVKVRLVPRNSA